MMKGAVDIWLFIGVLITVMVISLLLYMQLSLQSATESSIIISSVLGGKILEKTD